MSQKVDLSQINPDSIPIDKYFFEFINTLDLSDLLHISETFGCKEKALEIDSWINRNENGYNGNINVKKHGVQQQWNFHSIIEYRLCQLSPQYFAINYCKIINLDEGLVPFDLYDYQDQMFDHFNDNRFSIVLACRQSGKSISSVIYLLWFALFNGTETIAILANKGATAREMLSRITLALENLPFFLQTGVKVLNKGSIEFSNNSKMVAAATSGSSIRGLSISLLFLDEFAFIENDVQFYTSTYPVISSGKNSRIIITSTANGMGNTFYNIWSSAEKGKNEFAPFRVDWWDVPGRDEEWKRQTIANTSELQFAQEFSNQFLGSSGTLINGETLLGMSHQDPISYKDNVYVYDNAKQGHDYIAFVDVAKGRGRDYSTINIIDVTTLPYQQVCVFRDNKVSPLVFPDWIYRLCKKYNNAYAVIENNDQGQMVANALWYDFEYEEMFTSSTTKANAIGVNMDKKVKRIGCSNAKDLIESGKIEIRDLNTIIELTTFVEKGQSYEASEGNHDDLVMNFVLFGWFTSTVNWAEYSDESVRELIAKEKEKEIEESIIPLGIIENVFETTEDGNTDTSWTSGW